MTRPPRVKLARNDLGTALAPHIVTLRQLARRRTPLKGPVALLFTATEWEQLVEGVPVSDQPLAIGAVGLIPVPNPSGGILAFLACHSGGDPDTACFPATVAWDGQLVYGKCRCVGGGGDAPSRPSPKSPCEFGLPNCRENGPCLRAGLRCRKVFKHDTITFMGQPILRMMLVCECAR
jgi:predicted CxxxxCH...CXXCH cytochrome family protein